MKSKTLQVYLPMIAWVMHNVDMRRNRQAYLNQWMRAFRATPIGKATVAWENIKIRCGHSKRRSHKNMSYAGTELRVGRDDFLRWAIPEYTEWMSRNPGVRPSIDRINSKGHYELGNLRVISVSENAATRSNNKVIAALDGMAWCTRCQEYLPTEQFHKHSGRCSGYGNNCKACKLELKNS